MKAFPMFIKTTNRRVIIVGGGEAAAQKARLISKSDARIVFAATDLNDELQHCVKTGTAEQYKGPLTALFFADAAMVFVATGCFAIDVSAHAIAKAAGCYVNVVDQPHLCDLTTPSLVDRDPVIIAIGTEGTAPVLARQIKTRLETQLPDNLGGFAAFAGRCRAAVATHVPRAKRRAFWTWAFGGTPLDLWQKGQEADAARTLKSAITDNGVPSGTASGQISFVVIPDGGRDLLTLRAVQRLQDADLICHDASLGADCLELARRDAERLVLANKKDWDEVTDALDHGLSVVRLCASAQVAQDETTRLQRDGITCEQVPFARSQTETEFERAQQQKAPLLTPAPVRPKASARRQDAMSAPERETIPDLYADPARA